MLLIKTEIKDSKIHGLGLYTLQTIKKGDIIAKLNEFDIKISIEEIPPMYIEFFNHYFGKQKEYYQVYFDNMRFMNHSDDPNCINTNNGLCIAIKDIDIGDELTCDYSFFCDLWKNDIK